MLEQHAWHHNGRYPVASSEETVAIVRTWAATASIAVLASFALLGMPVPLLAIAAAFPTALLLMFGGCFLYRAYSDSHQKRAALEPGKFRVVVFGAGEGGGQTIRSMLRDPQSG